MNTIWSNPRRRFGVLLMGGVAIAAALIVEPPQARASFLDMFMGGGFGFHSYHSGGGYHHRRYYGASRSEYGGSRYYGASRYSRYSGAGRPNSAPPSEEEATSALTALAPPTTNEQTAVLKSIVPIRALGPVGASDDLREFTKEDQEKDDYTGEVEKLLKDLAPKQDREKRTGAKSTMPNDVTEHAVLEALDNAIRTTNLLKFETFRDENWSPERLRVMIVERLRIELGDLLDGGKHEATTMHDLETGIAKAARNVQARLFETSELLAADRGSTLFLQRLYQTHGDVSTDVRERTEQLLAKAAAAGVAPFEALMQRDPNSYALRYRGERIVYDCLTENLDTISSGEEAEIEQRIQDANRDQCSKWVAKQLVGSDGVLKPQEPMPLRVIWSADGPRTDPSMFSRAPDET
jgi:hypothetical protein